MSKLPVKNPYPNYLSNAHLQITRENTMFELPVKRPNSNY